MMSITSASATSSLIRPSFRARRCAARAQASDPSDKSVEIMRKFSEQYARRTSTFFCSEKSVTAVVIKGLADHKDQLGAPLCPCRHYDDKAAEAAQGFWNCPCVPMRERSDGYKGSNSNEGQGYSTSFNPAMAQHMQEENSKGMPMEEVNSSRLLAAGSLRSTAAEDCSGIRSLSFSRLFSSFRVARASSLDIDELASAPAADADADSCAEKESKQQQLKKQVCRTQSLPMNSIRSIPQHKKRVSDSSSLLSLNNSNSGGAVFLVSAESAAAVEEEEEVAEEEAVCRICMVALSGEGEGMKLECRCKGELALAHRACAVKWFSIKGNATCEVCSHNVLNLPVTLRRIPFPNPPPPPPSAEADTPQNGSMLLRRVWHGTPVLVVVSMLAYFCFLEQLLVGDHGTAALAISLPFAFVLGLFSSLTTTKMVSRRYIWIYSAVQFLFIVLFTHLFYRYVRIQAVIAIILSTFSGFSVAISINALLIQIIRWRASLASPSASDLEIAQP